MRMKRTLAAGTLLALAVLGAPSGVLDPRAAFAAGPGITTFDVPGALHTHAVAINAHGQIAGDSLDANITYHGYLREADGTIVTFDVPGAGTGSNQGTFPLSVNAAGQIAGYVVDVRDNARGFLRAPNGVISSFAAPRAGKRGFGGTFPQSLNGPGQIAGYYVDAESTAHAFVRSAAGSIATIEVAGALAVVAVGINSLGQVVGHYADAQSVWHSFVRNPDGTLVGFDAPDAGGPGAGTFARSINTAGEIAGDYTNASDGLSHGFVRAVDGTIESFDAPDAGGVGFAGTFARGIDGSGRITGDYMDPNGLYQGYERVNGIIASFAPPGAFNTFPLSIARGQITGSFDGNDGHIHAFVKN